jgi:glycosyltransferase involved in cell wall biosynthesis
MNLFLDYKFVEGPWGGINSFFRSLDRELRDDYPDVKLFESYDGADIILIGAANNAPGKEVDVNYIKNIKETKKIFSKKRRYIFQRLDGLRASYKGEFIPNDQKQLDIAQEADFLIFQSEESADVFERYLEKKIDRKVIYNGVDQKVFNLEGKSFEINPENIVILASSWSTGLNKGFEIISLFSLLRGVTMLFVGQWNKNVDKRNVIHIEALEHKSLAKLYKAANLFLHAAQNDPCPNVVLEALSSGLPLIYHPSGGTKELSRDFGVPLNLNDMSLEALEDTVKKSIENYKSNVEKIKKNHTWFSMKRAAREYVEYIDEKLRMVK